MAPYYYKWSLIITLSAHQHSPQWGSNTTKQKLQLSSLCCVTWSKNQWGRKWDYMCWYTEAISNFLQCHMLRSGTLTRNNNQTGCFHDCTHVHYIPQNTMRTAICVFLSCGFHDVPLWLELTCANSGTFIRRLENTCGGDCCHEQPIQSNTLNRIIGLLVVSSSCILQ